MIVKSLCFFLHLVSSFYSEERPVKRTPKVNREKKLARSTLAWWM